MHGKGQNYREIPSYYLKDGYFFKGSTVQHIERTKNTKVDELAKAVAKKAVLPPDVFF
jgi:hypothetical protein